MKEFLNENLINIVWAVSIILIVWLLIFFSMKKEEKIEKLKSWKTPSIKIDWIVKEIKYNQSRDWNIFWYFIAQGNNPIKNKITNFRSQDFLYGDWSVINFMGRPNKEKEKKLFEYARSLIKEWDTVKIYISTENSNIYYIRDFRSEDEFVLDAPIWSLKELDKIDMDKIQDIIGSKNINDLSWAWSGFKFNVLFGGIFVFVIIFIRILIDFLDSREASMIGQLIWRNTQWYGYIDYIIYFLIGVSLVYFAIKRRKK